MLMYKRLLWALRKMQLPVDEAAIVLDVGSGGNPHPRSDVLLDRLTGSEHRSGIPMLIDRTAVIGDATKLPFKDKSFDFVIASHILEHMPNPGSFLSELQRVGKAGYIETPNFISERFIPRQAHCLEVALTKKMLHIHKKASYLEDAFLGDLEFLEVDPDWNKLYVSDPAMFHVRYLWKDEIRFKIHNPEVSCEWIEDIYKNSSSTDEIAGKAQRRMGWRYLGASLYESIQKYRRHNRLKNFDIYSTLACPECRGDLIKSDVDLYCTECDIRYSNTPLINFERSLA